MACVSMRYKTKENKEVVVKGKSHEETFELAKRHKGYVVDEHTNEIIMDFRESEVKEKEAV